MGGEEDHACVHEGGGSLGVAVTSIVSKVTLAQSINLAGPELKSLLVVTQLEGPHAVG